MTQSSSSYELAHSGGRGGAVRAKGTMSGKSEARL